MMVDIVCTECGVESTKRKIAGYKSICALCLKKLEAHARISTDKYKAYQKKYRLEHPEFIAKHQLRYKQANREKIREANRLYHSKNFEKETAYAVEYRKRSKDKIKAKGERYREAFPDKVSESKRKYREGNREKLNADSSLYHKLNPDVLKASLHKRRAQKNSSLGGSFTRKEWEAVLSKHKSRCFDCGKSGDMTIGHIVPLSRGGSNHISNIRPQCSKCNKTQASKIHPKAEFSLWDRLIQ